MDKVQQQKCYRAKLKFEIQQQQKNQLYYLTEYTAVDKYANTHRKKNVPDNACLSNSTIYFWTASWNTSQSCSKTACLAQGRECSSAIAHCVFSALDKIFPVSSLPLRKDCRRSLKLLFSGKLKKNYESTLVKSKCEFVR